MFTIKGIYHALCKRLFFMLLISSFSLLIAMPALAATELAEGTYTISYEVIKPDDYSVSIANDYWLKPATLTVKNGKITVRHELKNSDWVVDYKVENNGSATDTKVVSTDKTNNKRTVEFNVSTIDEPTSLNIHVIVPDIKYDHEYTVRMNFDVDSLKLIKGDEAEVKATVTPKPDPTATPKPIETTKPIQSVKPADSNTTGTNTTTASKATENVNDQTASTAPIVSLVPNASANTDQQLEDDAVSGNGIDRNDGQQNAKEGSNEEEPNSTDIFAENDTEAAKPEVTVETVEIEKANSEAEAVDTDEVNQNVVASSQSSSNTGLIIGIIVVLLFIMAAAYYIYQKKKTI